MKSPPNVLLWVAEDDSALKVLTCGYLVNLNRFGLVLGDIGKAMNFLLIHILHKFYSFFQNNYVSKLT